MWHGYPFGFNDEEELYRNYKAMFTIPLKVSKAETDKVLYVFGELYGNIKVICNDRESDGFIISRESIAAKTTDSGQETCFSSYLSLCSSILKAGAQGTINTSDGQ